MLSSEVARCVGRVALEDLVVDNDAVGALHDLSLPAELDGLAEPTFLYRPGTWALQAHGTLGPLGHVPGHPAASLGDDYI